MQPFPNNHLRWFDVHYFCIILLHLWTLCSCVRYDFRLPKVSFVVFDCGFYCYFVQFDWLTSWRAMILNWMPKLFLIWLGFCGNIYFNTKGSVFVCTENHFALTYQLSIQYLQPLSFNSILKSDSIWLAVLSKTIKYKSQHFFLLSLFYESIDIFLFF